MFHDVDFGDSMPVEQYPYQMNPVKKEYLKDEILYLLDSDFIEPSITGCISLNVCMKI